MVWWPTPQYSLQITPNSPARSGVTVITMSSDLFPQSEVGTATGTAGMAANLGVLLFTLALGSLVDQVGYQPFFILLGVVDLVGAAVLWTLIRKPA